MITTWEIGARTLNSSLGLGFSWDGLEMWLSSGHLALTRPLRARRARPPKVAEKATLFSCFAAARAACVSLIDDVNPQIFDLRVDESRNSRAARFANDNTFILCTKRYRNI